MHQVASTTTELVGTGDFEFELNDSITTFKVWVEGVSVHDGLLGAASSLITSVNAFYMEYKLPVEVTCGDEVMIPVTVVNTTNDKLAVKLSQKSVGKVEWFVHNSDSRLNLSQPGPLTFPNVEAKKEDFAEIKGALNVGQSSRARTEVTATVDRTVTLLSSFSLCSP